MGLPRGRSVAVPYPKPNPAWTASWSVRDETASIEAVTFEKLRRVSAGNPGVALAIWEESVADGQIAPGYVRRSTADPSRQPFRASSSGGSWRSPAAA